MRFSSERLGEIAQAKSGWWRRICPWSSSSPPREKARAFPPPTWSRRARSAWWRRSEPLRAAARLISASLPRTRSASRWMRDAQRLVAAATDYERTEVLMRHELQRPPTEAELAEKLEWTIDRTRYVAQVVVEARRRHDEELFAFVDPDAIDFGDDDERAEFEE